MSINDPKYKFENDRIINEASGEPVPTDEPCMVFRARDVHAETAIAHYIAALVHDTQVPTSHVQAVVARLEAFRKFRASWPSRMKKPDTEYTHD